MRKRRQCIVKKEEGKYFVVVEIHLYSTPLYFMIVFDFV